MKKLIKDLNKQNLKQKNKTKMEKVNKSPRIPRVKGQTYQERHKDIESGSTEQQRKNARKNFKEQQREKLFANTDQQKLVAYVQKNLGERLINSTLPIQDWESLYKGNFTTYASKNRYLYTNLASWEKVKESVILKRYQEELDQLLYELDNPEIFKWNIQKLYRFRTKLRDILIHSNEFNNTYRFFDLVSTNRQPNLLEALKDIYWGVWSAIDPIFILSP